MRGGFPSKIPLTFPQNLFGKREKAGISVEEGLAPPALYVCIIREQCGIDSKTIRRLKANENIETKTLDKICAALGCRLEDIAEFVENKEI